jgi:hypothetical protein
MIVAAVKEMARNDVQVKIDAGVIREAKMVAAARGITVAEYLSEMIRPIVRKDLETETGRVLGSPSRPALPKPRRPKSGD